MRRAGVVDGGTRAGHLSETVSLGEPVPIVKEKSAI